jgi:hypothetical protein
VHLEEFTTVEDNFLYSFKEVLSVHYMWWRRDRDEWHYPTFLLELMSLVHRCKKRPEVETAHQAATQAVPIY